MNLLRGAINLGIITSNFELFYITGYILFFLYLFYFFRTELIILKHSYASFAEKIVNITYGKLFDKFKFLNIFFFFRNCLLFIIDDKINFNDIREEKKKLILLTVFVIFGSFIFGSAAFLLFSVILTYLIESEKKKYMTNIVYRNNFNNNLKILNTLESKTKISEPIKHYFLQKANMMGTIAKAGAENPKAISIAGAVAATAFGCDVAATVYDNRQTDAHNEKLRLDHKDVRDKVLAGNIDTQKTYRDAMVIWNKNGQKGPCPIPPTYVSEPLQPTYKEHRHTALGGLFKK